MKEGLAGIKRPRSGSDGGAGVSPRAVPAADGAAPPAPSSWQAQRAYHTSLDATPSTSSGVPIDLLILPGEERYLSRTGPSGIKIQTRLACTLHPANWCSEPPPFRSCLSEVAYEGRGGAKRRALAEVLASKIVEAREAQDPKSGDRRKALKGRAQGYQGVLAGSFADAVGSAGEGVVAACGANAVSSCGGPVGDTGAAEGAGAAAGCEMPPGPTAAAAPRRRGGLSMSLAPYTAVGAAFRGASPSPSPPEDTTFDTGVTEQILTASMGMDLAAAPIGGDSWLASDLIDFVACRLARAYPGVHFLPTNFLAFELPAATRSSEAALAYVATDLLGRSVRLRPDALPTAEMSATFYGPCVVQAPAPLPPAGAPRSSPPPAPAPPAPAAVAPTDAALFASAVRSVQRQYEKAESKAALLAEATRRLTAHKRTPAYAASVRTLLAQHPEWSPAEQTAGITKELDQPFLSRLVTEIYRHLAITMVNNYKAALAAGAGGGSAPAAPAVPAPAVPAPAAPAPMPAPAPAPAAPSLPASYRPMRFESSNLPLVFFWNQGNMHWNLVRVHTGLRKAIEIFEPMGKAERRAATTGSGTGLSGSGASGASGGAGGGSGSSGLSLRSVPKALISWLDLVCPLDGGGKPALAGASNGNGNGSGGGSGPLAPNSSPGHVADASSSSASSSSGAGGVASASWRSRTLSAITSPHQGNGFDCGVACLVYAEKCGQGMEREDIEAYTSQDDITLYRNLLHDFFEALREKIGGGAG